MASSTSQSTGQSIVNTISDAASCKLFTIYYGLPHAECSEQLRRRLGVVFRDVSETVQEYTSGASKEANKEVAKDSNQSIGTRMSAGIDALGDKADESKHSAKAEGYKESSKH